MRGEQPPRPLIELRELRKLYRMGTSIVRALDGADLRIERGEFVAITGASGSGKSTMMHLLGCLDRPTSGEYYFDGRNVSNLSDRQLAQIRNEQIGFVFQTFNLINRTSALDNVQVPMFYARKSSTSAPARRALERVGLAQRASHKSNELSGGERQRVAIARALVNDPLLLLADEPTGNLDSRTGQQIMDLFRELNAQGVTIIIVTHEYEVAVQARRIVQMRDGLIVADRRTEELIAEEGGGQLQRLTAYVPAAAQVGTPPPVAVKARPPGGEAAPAMPPAAIESADELDPSQLGPPRMARGATAAMILGILSGLFFVTWLAATVFTWGRKFDPKGMDPQEILEKMPRDLIIASTVGGLSLVLGFVIGIVAIIMAARVRKRIRTELGNWRGRGRALTGLLLGCLAVLGPIAGIILQALLKQNGAPGS